MNWKFFSGALVLSAVICGQSFGFELLNRMLGAGGVGCDSSCCDSPPICGCDAPPSCGCATPPSCGCPMVCSCKPSVVACRTPLFGHCKQSGCCDSGPACGCDSRPSCGCSCRSCPLANFRLPSLNLFRGSCGCCCKATCCNVSGCDAAPTCGFGHGKHGHPGQVPFGVKGLLPLPPSGIPGAPSGVPGAPNIPPAPSIPDESGSNTSPSDDEPELVPAAPIGPGTNVDPSAYYAPRKLRVARSATKRTR